MRFSVSTGVDKPVHQDEQRFRPEKSEVRALICDYRKATAAFGYAPQMDFDDGLARLRDYLIERQGAVRPGRLSRLLIYASGDSRRRTGKPAPSRSPS